MNSHSFGYGVNADCRGWLRPGMMPGGRLELLSWSGTQAGSVWMTLFCFIFYFFKPVSTWFYPGKFIVFFFNIP
ncbi:hypothetical protein ACTHPH_04175 [Paenibacillus pasadenensis]